MASGTPAQKLQLTNRRACLIISAMPTKSTEITPKAQKTKKPKKISPPVSEAVIEPVQFDQPKAEIKEENTITFKRSHFFTALSVLTFGIGLLLGYVIWGTSLLSKAGANPPAANQPPVAQEPQITRYKIPDQGYPSIGPDDAPITIVEFSDFQCPFCKQWNQTVYQPLLAAYPGKIRFVYRNLPLTSIHPDAQAAAEAAMCANEQNAFWDFHDKLFAGQSLGASVYSQYATELGLDMKKFDTCISNNSYLQAVQADSDFALNLGINSTPTFFVNGLAIVGAQPLSVFQQVIDKELAGEFPK